MCAAIFQIYMVVMFAALVVALSEEAYIFLLRENFVKFQMLIKAG